MLTVQEAFEQLLAEEVITNIETLRRWLRAGKIPDASIQSKKEGWRIPQESITTIIKEKQEASSQTDYKKGYKDGYKKAMTIYHHKTKDLILNGVYEKELTIYRDDFRQLASSQIKQSELSEFLLFSDDFLFQFGVRRPRMSLTCMYLDEWVYFPTEDMLFDLLKQSDQGNTIEQKILEALLIYLTQELQTR